MLSRQFFSVLNTRKHVMLRPSSAIELFSLQSRHFACDGSTGGPEVLEAMEKKLKEEFNPVDCKIVDPYGDVSSVQIFIVSEKFQGMLPLARHRAINALLKDEIKQIHAV